MTKAELIKKFAQNSGVPDSESRIFFEIFLRKLVSHLNLKQLLNIPGIGYFELKKDYITSNKGRQELDVIRFSQHIDFEEELIFNIPDEPEQSSSLDSYFSPSFGKPIIPLEGIRNNEFFISHSEIEYEKLLESKAEKILTGTEKTDGIEKEFHKPEKKEINWKSIPSDFKEGPEEELEEQTKVEDSEYISWNFGEGFEEVTEDDLNKPIQTPLQELEDTKADYVSDKAKELEDEEEILDTYPDDKVNIFDEPKTEAYLDETEPPKYESDTAVTGSEQRTEEIEKKGVPPELNERNLSDLEEVKPNLFSIDDYERVEPMVASLLSEEQESEYKEDMSNPEEKGNMVDEEGYTRVTPKISFLSQIKEEGEEKLESPDMPSEDEETIYDRDIIEKASGFRKKKKISKTRGSLVAIGVFAVLVVISGGIYLYTYYFGEKSFDTDIIPPKVRDKSQAIIIERSYDYPVTYPYNKNTIVGLFDGINLDLFKTTLEEEQSQSSSSITEIETYEARPSKRIKGYIYQYDGFYAVQVSSWKSLSIAQSEMLKYKNGGLNAFIEEAQVEGSTYYRVRVGFKTLEEVEVYLAK